MWRMATRLETADLDIICHILFFETPERSYVLPSWWTTWRVLVQRISASQSRAGSRRATVPDTPRPSRTRSKPISNHRFPLAKSSSVSSQFSKMDQLPSFLKHRCDTLRQYVTLFITFLECIVLFQCLRKTSNIFFPRNFDTKISEDIVLDVYGMTNVLQHFQTTDIYVFISKYCEQYIARITSAVKNRDSVEAFLFNDVIKASLGFPIKIPKRKYFWFENYFLCCCCFLFHFSLPRRHWSHHPLLIMSRNVNKLFFENFFALLISCQETWVIVV